MNPQEGIWSLVKRDIGNLAAADLGQITRAVKRRLGRPRDPPSSPRAIRNASAYVMNERSQDTDSRLVFLIGGRGTRRLEPLGYDGLVRMFSRACARAGIREPWVTPHALRRTHATRMWEGGMRELTLQKRLGHASPESTRLSLNPRESHQTGEKSQVARSSRKSDGLRRYYELAA